MPLLAELLLKVHIIITNALKSVKCISFSIEEKISKLILIDFMHFSRLLIFILTIIHFCSHQFSVKTL